MLKKIVCLLLVALILNSVNIVFAATKDDIRAIEKIKSQVAKIGSGTKSRVKIKLKDGTQIKGTISGSDDEKLVVIDEKTGQPTSIPYSQVNHLSKRVVGYIIVGAIFVTLIVLVATAKD